MPVLTHITKPRSPSLNSAPSRGRGGNSNDSSRSSSRGSGWWSDTNSNNNSSRSSSVKSSPLRGRSIERNNDSTLNRNITPSPMSKGDFYFRFENFLRRYMDELDSGISFNNACISIPTRANRLEAEKLFKLDKKLTSEERESIYLEVRKVIQKLVNFDGPFSQIILARNATEAGSFVEQIAGLESGDEIVMSNAEHSSVVESFKRNEDYGYPNIQDEKTSSTLPRYYAQKGKNYTDFESSEKSFKIKRFGLGKETYKIGSEINRTVQLQEIKAELEKTITQNTKLLVLSHVLRDRGQILPVKEIADIAREIKIKKSGNPNAEIFIHVDGAQALASVKKIDLKEWRIDSYMGSGQKAFKAEVMGFLCVHKDHDLKAKKDIFNSLKPRNEKVILRGMFDPEIGIATNLPEAEDDHLCLGDVGVFKLAFEDYEKKHELKNNDFSIAYNERGILKEYLKRELQKLGTQQEFEIKILEVPDQVTSILNFQILGINQRELAKMLSFENEFFTYVKKGTKPEENYYRLSIDADMKGSHIRKLTDQFRKQILEIEGGRIRKLFDQLREQILKIRIRTY